MVRNAMEKKVNGKKCHGEVNGKKCHGEVNGKKCHGEESQW